MKNPAPNDSILIAQYIQQNDQQAFERLFNRHQIKISHTIYNIVRDRDLTEDLLQETFVKAIKTIQQGGYKDEGKFQPWICRIAHNLAIDYFRRSKRYNSVNIEDRKDITNHMDFCEESVEYSKIKEELHSKLNQLIELLPAPQKEVLTLRHFHEMSFAEIAETTRVSINTALGRMRYALINLRKQASKYNICLEEYLTTH